MLHHAGWQCCKRFFIGATTTSQDSSVFLSYVPCYSHMVPDDDECLTASLPDAGTGKRQKVKVNAKLKAKLKPGHCLSPVGFLARLVSELQRADRNNLNRGQFRAQVTRPLNIAHVNFKPPNSFHKWFWRVWFVTHGPLLCSLRGRARQLKLLKGNARLGAQPERTAEPFGLGSHILRVGVAGSTCKDISTFGCLVHVDVKTFVWSLDLAGRPCRHGINMHGHLAYVISAKSF